MGGLYARGGKFLDLRLDRIRYRFPKGLIRWQRPRTRKYEPEKYNVQEMVFVEFKLDLMFLKFTCELSIFFQDILRISLVDLLIYP